MSKWAHAAPMTSVETLATIDSKFLRAGDHCERDRNRKSFRILIITRHPIENRIASIPKIFQKIIALRSFASYRTRVSYKRGRFFALMGHVAASRKEEIPRTARDDGDQNPIG